MAAKSISISYRVDDKAVRAALRDAVKKSGPEIRDGLRGVADRVAVPKVRRLAPGSLAGTIHGHATTRSAFVQTRDPRAGLLNFGGTRRDVLKPTGGRKALRLPWGFRAKVKTPRRYKGQHFMERGVQASIGDAIPLLEDAVFDAFRRAGFEVR